jgi:uncharacterized protein with HEPN domain
VPSKDPLQRFEDILENIARIERYTPGMNAAEFMRDRMVYDAVERCLERISEAAKKLGASGEEYCPGIPWAEIRALGNFLRHEYDRIESERLWLVVERDLPPLKQAVLSVLGKLRQT